MTTPGAREPSNEELWAQPPAAFPAAAPQQPNLPAPVAAPAPVPVPVEQPTRQNHGVLALAITSLGVGIPITAIASSESGTVGLVAAWIGIVGVNAVYAWSQRR